MCQSHLQCDSTPSTDIHTASELLSLISRPHLAVPDVATIQTVPGGLLQHGCCTISASFTRLDSSAGPALVADGLSALRHSQVPASSFISGPHLRVTDVATLLGNIEAAPCLHP